MPSDQVDLPHRAWTMTLKVGADSELELERALLSIATDFSMGGLRSTFASGGPGAGWSGETKHDPSMTHERYFEAIEAWRKSRKETPGE